MLGAISPYQHYNALRLNLFISSLVVLDDHNEYPQVTLLKNAPEPSLTVIDVWTIQRPFGELKSDGKCLLLLSNFIQESFYHYQQ